MVEIARALSMQSRLIVMDEPTSALSETETQRLFAIVRDLKREGISTIFVTHRLAEVLQICDRITVLRDGRLTGKADIQGLTMDRIIRMMVGRSAHELFEPLPERTAGPVVLQVDWTTEIEALRCEQAFVHRDQHVETAERGHRLDRHRHGHRGSLHW